MVQWVVGTVLGVLMVSIATEDHSVVVRNAEIARQLAKSPKSHAHQRQSQNVGKRSPNQK